MYDIEKALKTPKQCRTVMEHALARGEKDLYAAAFRQFCKLSGADHDDPSDPLNRATFEAVAAYEQTLKEKHGKNQPASRTRQKLTKKGAHQSLVDWSKLHGNRSGFHALIEAGLPEFTFEAVVVRFADQFTPDVVASCRETLRKAHEVTNLHFKTQSKAPSFWPWQTAHFLRLIGPRNTSMSLTNCSAK